jgi:hypothetical protein
MQGRRLFLFCVVLFLKCGYMDIKPGPVSDRAAKIDICFNAFVYISNSENKEIQRQRENTYLLCVLYAQRFSNDPTDCQPNDIVRLLEKTKIFIPRGCDTISPRK